MTGKADFTKDEWTLLLKAPMNAGVAVTAADPSGLFGLLKESFASGTVLAKAAMDPDGNALVKAVADDYQTSEGRSAAHDGLKAEFGDGKPAEIKTKAIESLRQVGALLAAKAPADAPAFKAWLTQIGEKTAEAANEGGLFSSAPATSAAEKATLGEIAGALGAGA